MKILGLSAYYHDSAAALIRDGQVVAAAQEERFSRLKHDPAFPRRAAEFCLASHGLTATDLDAVVFYEKPLLKLDRILITHLRNWPRAFANFEKAQRLWLGGRMRIGSSIREELGYRGPVLFSKHHESHAAAAFFASGFERAAILVVDGVGEWATTTILRGDGAAIAAVEEQRYPHSLGLFYSAFTDYLGFEVNDGEYKVMGLAPYGEPAYKRVLLEEFIECREDGAFRLRLERFAYDRSDRMLDFAGAAARLGFPRRTPDQPLEKQHRDLAASVQSILEDAMMALVRRAMEKAGSRNVCLAGGVALNCTANSKIRRSSGAEALFIFPASGDAGGAVGAALNASHMALGEPRHPNPLPSIYLGPSFADDDIEAMLRLAGHPYRKLRRDEIAPTAARLIHEQNIIGWFQGPMEFGPRALGHRSILADPTRAENWPRINRKVKFREGFRPFAPSVLEEAAAEYFDFEGRSPYMLLVAENRTAKLPAVTHADRSSRLHTVRREENPLYHDLLSEFGRLSGVPVVVNTSFNTSGMPIVCTPQNAVQCFIEAELDALILGSFLLLRREFPYLVARTNGGRE